MNTLYLKHFCAVAQHGSFIKAARETYSSQPTLSRSVRLLEKELKLNLMVRGKGGVRLTEDGKLLYSESKDLLERLYGLEARIRRQPTNKKLNIAASENLCNHALPVFVKRLLDAGLASTVDLYSGTAEQIEERVTNAQADFGLFYNPPRNPWLKCRTLGEVEFKLIFPKGAGRKDLNRLPFIGSRISDYSQPYFALRALQKNGIRPIKMLESNSQEFQLRMVLQGVGYTVVPSFLARPYSNKLSTDADFSEYSKVHCVFRNTVTSEIWELLRNSFDRLRRKDKGL